MAEPGKWNERMKAMRVRKKLSQQELAARSGIVAVTYSGYERGEYYPRFDVMCKLATGLNMSNEAFVMGLLGSPLPRSINETPATDEEPEETLEEKPTDSRIFYIPGDTTEFTWTNQKTKE